MVMGREGKFCAVAALTRANIVNAAQSVLRITPSLKLPPHRYCEEWSDDLSAVAGSEGGSNPYFRRSEVDCLARNDGRYSFA